MANFTALAAARHAVLRNAGWDVEEAGLIDAPPIRVIVGADVHVADHQRPPLPGTGARPRRADPERRRGPHGSRTPWLTPCAGRSDPTIVCAQLGEVNTGAFDPIEPIVAVVRQHPNAWLHVDGAFGLWAAASPRLRHLVRGHDGADSWGTDAHKWLNVPYDAGVVFVRDAAAHRAAMGIAAAYLPPAPGQERDPFDYVPEMSKRAPGIPDLRRDPVARRDWDRRHGGALLRPGVADGQATGEPPRHPDRQRSRAQPGPGRRRRRPTLTADVVARVQADGTLWLGGSTFHGTPTIRISVSGWNTRECGYRSIGRRDPRGARCRRARRAGGQP